MKNVSILLALVFICSVATARDIDPRTMANIQKLSSKILTSRANSKHLINEDSKVVREKIKLLRSAIDDALDSTNYEGSTVIINQQAGTKKSKSKQRDLDAKEQEKVKRNKNKIAKIEAKLEKISRLKKLSKKGKSKILNRQNKMEAKIDKLVTKLKTIKDKMKAKDSLEIESLVSLQAELTPPVYRFKHHTSPTTEAIKAR